MEFDTEKYIYEIENRPPLWNMKSKEYSDRILKIKMWEEIVDIFGEKEMTTDEKKNLGLSLQKKWKNLRDAFVKEYRKVSTLKSGSGATQKSTYIYFNQLMFLKDVVAINKRDNNFSEERQETQEQATEGDHREERGGPYETTVQSTPRQKKTKANETEGENIGAELISVLKENISCNDNDPDRHFLLSLLNDFKRVPDRLKAMTKINMIKVIMEATDQHYNYQLPPPQPQNYSRNAYFTVNPSANTPSCSLNRNITNEYDTVTNVTSPESGSQMSEHSQASTYYELYASQNL